MTENKIALYLGDCLELMESIPDASVDMILCDLPYGTTACKWDSVIPFESLWAAYKRIIKNNGVIALFAQTPFDKALGASNLSMLKYEWVWEKTQATGHLNAKRAPMKAHENILIFYKKQPIYNPQKTSGHKPMNTGVRKLSATNNCYGKFTKEMPFGNNTDRFPRSVITYKSDKQTNYVHPTQKPVALMEYLIRTYTNEGETVLDNCMGSGTTGIACINTNRNFIGIEKEEKYFRIAQERINHAVAQVGLSK